MSAIGPRLVAMLLGLAGPPDRFTDLPAEAEVVAESLDVFDEPDAASSAPVRLKQGDRITVRDTERAGWLTIDPPPGSFCWIEQSSIAIDAADPKHRARVINDRGLVRSGHPGARMPGAPRATLPEGTVVKLLDRFPLTLGRGRAQRTWRAIEPPPGDVRHIRAEGVRPLVASSPTEGAEDTKAELPPIAEIRAGYAPQVVESPPSPEITGAIAQIESIHRAVLREPIERWHLEDVRRRYETLLRSAADTGSGNAIRERLDVVARHEAMARDARLIATLLERSRRRDSTLSLHQRRLSGAQQSGDQPYEVQGLIQPSSRKVGGQKVFALIGGDGTTLAYLEIPPGIDVKRFLTRRVGVRGTVHYNEGLRARLISVRDLEPLD